MRTKFQFAVEPREQFSTRIPKSVISKLRKLAQQKQARSLSDYINSVLAEHCTQKAQS